MLTLITDHFRNIKKNICCTKLFVKNISKILSFILLDDHLSNSLFKFNALWNRTFFDGLGILKPQYISFSFIYNSACNNKTPTEVIFMHILERRALYYDKDRDTAPTRPNSVYPHHFSSHKKVADQNFKTLP
jgi:hypothetical protein